MIGVTGTSGKTTSTYLIKSILEQKAGAKVGLVGTIQNMIGDQVLHTERTTPESFELQKLFRQMSDAGCTHVVMEVSSHALALDRVYGIRFAVGIFTNLSQDHLDFHHTMEEYCDAKAILFDRCDVAIYNADDPWHQRMLAHCSCRTFSYSAKGEADLSAKSIQLHAGSVDYDAEADTEWAHVHVGIPAIFTVYNTLDAIAADHEDIATYTHQEEGSYADTDLMNWVFDADRAAGDTNTVTTDSTIYFVLFHSRARQDYNVVNARHILFRVDDSTLDSTSETYEADLAALKETAHNDAEDALKKWQDDGATAELFAQMATELSADTGSTANGGLYEGITKSTSFVQEFLDWCFADGRKEGDAGVIDSSYGSHVMYLDSFGDPYWKVQATNTLKNEAYDTWLAEQSTAETITDGSGMQYVGY